MLFTYVRENLPTVITVAGFLAFGWFGLQRGTNTLLKEQNAALKTQNEELKGAIKELTEKYTATLEAGAKMQGQIDMLSKLPLKGIATSIKTLADTHGSLIASNDRILEILKLSATTLVKDTHDAAVAAEAVKTTLADHPAI